MGRGDLNGGPRRPCHAAFASMERLRSMRVDPEGGPKGRFGALADSMPWLTRRFKGNPSVTGYHVVDAIASLADPFLALVAVLAARRRGLSILVCHGVDRAYDADPFDGRLLDDRAFRAFVAQELDLPEGWSGVGTEVPSTDAFVARMARAAQASGGWRLPSGYGLARAAGRECDEAVLSVVKAPLPGASHEGVRASCSGILTTLPRLGAIGPGGGEVCVFAGRIVATGRESALAHPLVGKGDDAMFASAMGNGTGTVERAVEGVLALSRSFAEGLGGRR